ncbi:hypothetical protein [Streptomyces sp. NPDC002054]|uniref:hypothetical protein n=1 Tax=Streptomyces sp. NPDC002054 TaxID=3154663 RepID=UPI003332B11C
MIDHDAYLAALSRSEAVFDSAARLPGQVFKGTWGESLFYDFDSLLAPEIWPALCEMARWHGDDRIDLVVLKPDCQTYYLNDYQVYPAVSLSVDATEDDYWEAISHEPKGDIFGSIAISANVITLTGPSGQWGCWGERDPEVSVFRGFPSPGAQNEWRERFGPFTDAQGALETSLAMVFRDNVPTEYAERLTANYGPPKGKHQ